MDPFVEIFGHPAQWHPQGTVRIGRVTLPPQAVADILIEAREEGATNRRAGEVTLHIADTSELPVWSNQDAIAIDVDGQQQFIGVIERVYAVGPAELRIRFVDRIRLLELGKLGIVHGNVPKGQVLAFIWRLGLYSGWPDLQLHGFDENPARRPFLFAVPFGNMTWTAPGPVGFQFAETAILCNDSNGLSAITGYPIPQFDDKFLESFPEWRPNVPKIMGVVLATEFFLARLAALQRTQIVYDLVLAASRLVENRLPGRAVQGLRGTYP